MKILKWILSFLLLGGCVTHEYTVMDPPVPYQYPISIQTQNIADLGAEDLDKKYNVYTADIDLQAGIEDIANNIIRVCELPGLEWKFYILDSEEMNALSLGDGRICINLGLIELLQTEEKIAAVLAHEVGHTCARHLIRKYEHNEKVKQYTDSASAVILSEVGYGTARNIINIGKDLTKKGFIFSYSRKQEYHADQIAMRYLVRAGYDPAIFIEMLADFQKASKSSKLFTFFSTHPSGENRIQDAQKFLEYVTKHEKSLVKTVRLEKEYEKKKRENAELINQLDYEKNKSYIESKRQFRKNVLYEIGYTIELRNPSDTTVAIYKDESLNNIKKLLANGISAIVIDFKEFTDKPVVYRIKTFLKNGSEYTGWVSENVVSN
jgi:predicted Zn-dependent protease